MENAEVLTGAFNEHFARGKACVEKRDLIAARKEFFNALKIARELFEGSDGEARARAKAYMARTGAVIDKIDEKLGRKPAISKLVRPRPSEEEIAARISSLEGEEIKRTLSELNGLIKSFALRKSRGLPVPHSSHHMVFGGNPGTGKTTAARIVADIFYAYGALEKGQLIETSPDELVAQYIGQTPARTRAVLEKAMGGVLLINDAYMLDRLPFGQEVIYTFMQENDAHHGEFILIFAGYAKGMREFLSKNWMLSPRISRYLDFPDFKGEELYRIFLRMCEREKLVLTEEASKIAQEYFDGIPNTPEGFGNARAAGKYFDDMCRRQARRLMPYEREVSDVQLCTVLPEDLA